MRKMRCNAELTISVTGSAAPPLELWPGVEIDVDRELAPGVTIVQLTVGREGCFEPIADEESQS